MTILQSTCVEEIWRHRSDTAKDETLDDKSRAHVFLEGNRDSGRIETLPAQAVDLIDYLI
jgi:hypothetical protein